jgi:hypothetical protein
MSLVVGVRWSFRGKDAGSTQAFQPGCDGGRGLGASSALRRLSRRFAKPSCRRLRGIGSVRTGCYSGLWKPLEMAAFQAYLGSEEPVFASEYELECAKILDYYGVPWEYEPRTFVLERDEQGRVVEAFTPDFYLPEQDLYLELTVMKQSLATRKNRKLRKLRELYPDVNVKLFYKRDIERLAQRYRLKLA